MYQCPIHKHCSEPLICETCRLIEDLNKTERSLKALRAELWQAQLKAFDKHGVELAEWSKD